MGSETLRWFVKRGGERVLQYRVGHQWIDVPEETEDEPARDEGDQSGDR